MRSLAAFALAASVALCAGGSASAADKDAEAVAKRLTATKTLGERSALMGDLFADPIMLEHTPPNPNDGPIKKENITRTSRAEAAAIAKILPDERAPITDIKVDGDKIDFTSHLQGNRSDGGKADVKLRTVIRVKGGQIVGMEAKLDPEEAKKYSELLKAGGFRSGAAAEH